MANNNLTKKNLSDQLNQQTGFPVNFSKKIINDLINIISVKIKKNKFNLMNIGSFKVIQKKERTGRNPKNSKNYTISARKSLSFIASKKLTKLLNKNE